MAHYLRQVVHKCATLAPSEKELREDGMLLAREKKMNTHINSQDVMSVIKKTTLTVSSHEISSETTIFWRLWATFAEHLATRHTTKNDRTERVRVNVYVYVVNGKAGSGVGDEFFKTNFRNMFPKNGFHKKGMRVVLIKRAIIYTRSIVNTLRSRSYRFGRIYIRIHFQ